MLHVKNPRVPLQGSQRYLKAELVQIFVGLTEEYTGCSINKQTSVTY